MEAAVSLGSVVKAFGERRAVDGVSLGVPPGHVYGLLGPNGAGKTTMIRMIMDIIRPDSGEVRVFDRPPGKGVRSRVGYLPEERGLYKKMKLLDVLEFQGSIKGARPAEARREAGSWLDRLGLGEWKDKKVEELSKGMQQKVQFIAAVLGRPDLLILDEPFSGMDPVNQDLFKEAILDLNRKGATVLFSTHQMETAEKLCRGIALINKGHLVLEGPLVDVKRRFGKNTVLLAFEGDGSFLRTHPAVGSLDDYGGYSELRLHAGADPQDVLLAAASRVRISRFEIVAPSLHNIFIEQVGGRSALPAETQPDA
jgi:ABC-2 type transport system ATP-binding protein